MSKLSRAVKFILGVWIVAFCLAIPQAIQFGVVPINGGHSCTVSRFLSHFSVAKLSTKLMNIIRCCRITCTATAASWVLESRTFNLPYCFLSIIFTRITITIRLNVIWRILTMISIPATSIPGAEHSGGACIRNFIISIFRWTDDSNLCAICADRHKIKEQQNIAGHHTWQLRDQP